MLFKFSEYKFSVFTIEILDNVSDSTKIKKGYSRPDTLFNYL
jgi:hypothetical protein